MLWKFNICYILSCYNFNHITYFFLEHKENNEFFTKIYRDASKFLHVYSTVRQTSFSYVSFSKHCLKGKQICSANNSP